MKKWVYWWLLSGLLVGGACSSGEPSECTVGSKGCSCYPNLACNSGLVCEDETCAEPDDATGGSGGIGGGDENLTATASSSGGSQGDGGTSAGGSGGTTSGSASGGSAAGGVTSNGGSGGTTQTATTGDAGSGGVTSSGGDTSTSDTGSSSSGGGVGGSAGAGGGSVEAVNLYLMIDAGTSMIDNEVDGVTRWDLVTTGINDFLSSPELTGNAVNVGIQFFAWFDDSDCDVSNYSTASVDIGPVADVSALIASEFDNHEVGGLTPTYPALSGAIAYAKDWAATTAGEHTAVVFLTDGYPTQCEPLDITAMAELAAASYADAPSVPVHIVGIDGVYNLDAIAAAGGTGEALEIVSAEELTAELVSIATSPFGDG